MYVCFVEYAKTQGFCDMKGAEETRGWEQRAESFSFTQPVHSFINSFLQAFIHSFTLLQSVHSFIHSLIHLFVLFTRALYVIVIFVGFPF